MATIDFAYGGTTGHPARDLVDNVYKIEKNIDWATALTSKGSALAAADVVESIQLPAGSMLLGGGVEVVTAADSTTLTVDFGWGGSVDVIADGVDAKTTGYGAAGTNGSLSRTARFSSADTLDITLATLTGTLTTGEIRVYAIVADIS